MTGTFADSFYFIALLNPADQFHAQAVRFSRETRKSVITTTWILVEVADAFSAPGLRRYVRSVFDSMSVHPQTRIIAADDAWYARGLALYDARPDKGWSLTDCISFEVMGELGLSEALTGDHHFEQAGFRALFKGD